MKEQSLPTYADVCRRMPTYADVCRRMPVMTYALYALPCDRASKTESIRRKTRGFKTRT